MELYFNKSGIKQDVKTDMKDAKKSLNSAKQKISSISAPEGFSDIKKVANNIENIKNKIDKFNDKIDKIVEKFENAEKENTSIMNGLKKSTKNIKMDTAVDLAIFGNNMKMRIRKTVTDMGLESKLGSELTKKIEQKIEEGYEEGSINLDNMSNEEINEEVIQIILKECTTDEIFTFFNQMSGSYGVDQGCLSNMFFTTKYRRSRV